MQAKMVAPLLTTKLYAPPVRPELVSRSRLTQRLDVALSMGRKLTLISAPAGFGKTTLLSEWAHHRAGSGARLVAWLSLDRDDSDPTRFVAYVIAALQTFEASIGSGVQEILRSPQPPIDAILTALINEIAAIPDECVLVLDDYHLIDSQPIYDAVIFLMDHLPPNMHVVIATRKDPRLSLPRLRAAGQMEEIRGRDLRFTEGETTTFLNQAMGLDLTPSDVAALAARTEGWIAGLQLAALSLQGQENRAAFIRAFAGDDRYVMDYLVNEVLSRQTEAVRRFMLHTAILERLCASLCDAALGEDPNPGRSQQVLEYLEEANLFVVPLDHKRQWYRYHHLFGDLLRHRLRRTLGEEGVASLHRRASAWYAQNSYVSEAIDHSVAAGDWERVVELIGQVVNDVLGGDEYFATILGWVDALPPDVVRAHPHLGVTRAWMLMLMLRTSAAQRCLEQLESAADAPLPDEVRVQVTAIRAFLARQANDVRQAIELSHQVLDAVEKGVTTLDLLRPMAALNLANVYRMTGDVSRARHWYAEVLAVPQAGVTLALAVMNGQASVEIVAGQLPQAFGIYQRALQLADEAARRTGQVVPAVSFIYTGLVDLLREWNRLDEAADYLARGLDLGRQWAIGMTLGNGYVSQARLRLARGDMAGALEALRRAESLPLTYRTAPRFGEPIAVCRARLMLAQAAPATGEMRRRLFEALEGWVQARDLGADGPVRTLDHELEYLLWVRLLIAQGRPDQALRLLARLLTGAEESGRTGRAIEILALQALAHRAFGDARLALAALEQALTLAKPGGYVRTFVDEGKPMFELLRSLDARRSVVDTGYVNKLLDAFGPAGTAGIVTEPESEPKHLPLEPLTQREMQVLRMLRTDLSVPEIAQELHISANTVKTHVKRIYGKLDAHSRYEAVARAEGLGLTQ
jgi:LuxR family maltose regulon positive regulatory protein